VIGYAAYVRAIADGIMAQRKLDGDRDVFAPDDPETLNSIVRQGKRAEERCIKEGWLNTLERGRKLGRDQIE